jgi:ankyrin repeat protein
MLGMGSDPNAAISTGWTPLAIAAAEDRPGVVQLLLEKGADVEAKNADGKTAAMLAAENGHTGIVEILKKAPAAVPSAEPSPPGTDTVKEVEGEI